VDPEREGWRYEVELFASDGTPASEAALVVTRADAPSEDTFLLRLGEDRFATLTTSPTADGMSRVTIKRFTAGGQVQSGEGSIVRDPMIDVHALGFSTGVIALSWRELDRETLVETQYTLRFGAESPLSDPQAFAIPDTAIRRARLSRRSAGWALFFLGERALGEDDVRVVGYQAMEGDAPTGNAVYLEPEDRRGCPDELVGGFDAAGFAWATVSDRECGSAMRGWFAGASTIALAPFDQALHPAATTSQLAAATSGAGFVLAFVATGDAALPGLYVQRYGANAAPSYLPSSLSQ
jgi:hypothetical protein